MTDCAVQSCCAASPIQLLNVCREAGGGACNVSKWPTSGCKMAVTVAVPECSEHGIDENTRSRASPIASGVTSLMSACQAEAMTWRPSTWGHVTTPQMPSTKTCSSCVSMAIGAAKNTGDTSEVVSEPLNNQASTRPAPDSFELERILEELATSTAQPNVQLNLLKQALESSEEAASAATVYVTTRMQSGLQQADETPLLQSCRLIRAICLAGRSGHLAGSTIPEHLLLLLKPTTSSLVRAAACEALISLAIRDPCIGDQLLRLGCAGTMLDLLQPPAAGQAASRLLLLVSILLETEQVVATMVEAGLCSVLAALACDFTAVTSISGSLDVAESAAAAAVQYGTLKVLLNISSHTSLHLLLIDSGIAASLGQLLGRCPSMEVLELAVAVVHNLAAGSGNCQEALVEAGLAGPLLRLLSFKSSSPLLLKVLDTIASFAAASPSAQSIVSSAADGAAFALLLRMLRCKQPTLVAKTCRCLRNLTQEHRGNQAALLATPGAVSALVSLLGCGLPQIVRLALGCLANLLGQQQGLTSFKAGALPQAVKLLCRVAGGGSAAVSRKASLAKHTAAESAGNGDEQREEKQEQGSKKARTAS